MRPGAFIPALALGAALLAPPLAGADPQRSPERGRRPAHERSVRDRDGYGRGHSPRSYRQGQPRDSYRHGRPGHARGDRRPAYRAYRPRYARPYRPYYRPYYRPHYRPYYYGYYRPYPRYPVPGPPPYGPWVPYRGGVHGHVSIGLPFIGFSLHF